MLAVTLGQDDLSPRAACHPTVNSPISPTYTSYSPSPFSSGSSASYLTHSPVSEAFESLPDPDHHHQTDTMDSYRNGYTPLSTSLSAYNDLGYPSSPNFDYTMSNWPSSDVTRRVKRHPPQHPLPHPQQFQQQPHGAYRSEPSQSAHTADFDRSKSLELYIPSASPIIFPQHQQSPTVIYSPVPIPVASSLPYDPSPPTSTSLPASHLPRTHALRRVSQQHQSGDHYFSVDNLTDQWRPSSADINQQQQHMNIYPQSHPLREAYNAPAFVVTNSMADYSSNVDVNVVCGSSIGRRIKREDLDMYAAAAQHPDLHQQTHTFDLSVSSAANQASTSAQAAQTAASSSSMPPYFNSRGAAGHPSASPDLNLSNLRIQDGQAYTAAAIAAAEIQASSANGMGPSGSGFDALTEAAAAAGYIGEATQQREGAAHAGIGYTPVESEYVDVCDPRYAMRASRDEECAGLQHKMWDVEGRPCHVPANGEYAHDADADAEGEDDLEGYASPQYTVQERPSPSPGMRKKFVQHQTSRVVVIKEEDAEEFCQPSAESDGDIRDDKRDPDFVLRTRPRRHTYTSSSSYNGSETGEAGRHLRSSRYNPYPPTSPNSARPSSSTDTHFRARRSSYTHTHTSVSPSHSEPYSPISMCSSIGSVSCPQLPLSASSTTTTFSIAPSSPMNPNPSANANRRRLRQGSGNTSGSLPIPIPVPNLTKKSRGRRVPTLDDMQVQADDWPSFGVRRKPVSVGGIGDGCGAAGGKTGMRTYTCGVDGCGKLFARGEHLKRHIRSIHTYEKPHLCPYPGCGKDFSRHDNLGQHMRVHKDYVPPPKEATSLEKPE